MITNKLTFIGICLCICFVSPGYQFLRHHNLGLTPKKRQIDGNDSASITQQDGKEPYYVPDSTILERLKPLEEHIKRSFESIMQKKIEELGESGIRELRERVFNKSRDNSSSINTITRLRPRIVGGTEAIMGQFPYQILMLYTKSPFDYCGGSLVTDEWVLTAAHCLRDRSPDSFVVTAGEHSLDNDATEQPATYSAIFVHPENEGRKKYDIALGKLDRKLVYSPYVQPIKLGTVEVPPHTPCVISGWGKTGKAAAEQTGVLRMAMVFTMPQSICDEFWGPGEDRFCTYDPKPNSPYVGGCYGDSGGPLACYFNEEWLLTGVISFGPTDCGEKLPFKPSGYASVPFLIRWIAEVVLSNSTFH